MVVDTNIAITFILEHEASIRDLLIYNKTYSPVFGKFEFLNILRKYHFLKQVPMVMIDQGFKDYLEIIDKFIPDEDLLELANQLSFKFNHAIYDCLFLALAIELKQPFFSADQKLINKAESIGIEIIKI